MSTILALDVWEHIVVHLANLVCSEHLDDDVALACLCAYTQRDNVGCLNFIYVDVGFNLDRLIRIQFVDIDLTIGLLEFLFELFSDWYDISILDDLLGELVEELLLGHRVETIKIRQLLESWVLPQLIVIRLIDHVDWLQRDALGVLLLQVVREVAVEDVREHRLRLLRVVRVEWHAFDHETVCEEENWHIIVDFEAAHAWRYRLEALFLGDEIELFNTLLKDFSVNFTRHVRSILGSLELQLFLDRLIVELAFTLTAISTDPLEAVIGEELRHFLAL